MFIFSLDVIIYDKELYTYMYWRRVPSSVGAQFCVRLTISFKRTAVS